MVKTSAPELFKFILCPFQLDCIASQESQPGAPFAANCRAMTSPRPREPPLITTERP